MKLQPNDRQRFDALKQTVNDGMAICFIVGAALREIKDRKFYLADGHKTFEEFANAEWGWTKRYANQLIVDADAINSLPPPMRKLITSHRAAAELAKIPETLRAEVVKVAVGDSDGEPVSAAKVRAACPPIPPRASQKPPEAKSAPPPTRPAPKSSPNGQPERGKPGPKPEVPTDSTGLPIPAESLDLWRKAEDAQSLVTYIGGVISRLEDYKDGGHELFVEVDFVDDIAKLKNVREDLRRAIPYAVCSECNGVQPKGCAMCKGRGFFSRFIWDNVVPDEIKSMRKYEKAKK